MASYRGTFASDRTRGSAQSTSHSRYPINQNSWDSSLANSTNCANLRHGYNSSSNGYIAGRLPLPDDFFPVPQLSTKEKNYLLGLAKHACKEMVYYSRQNDGPMKWIQLASNDGVNVFQGVDNSGNNNTQDTKALTYLRGACKIHATIDEISDFFKLDTPEKLSGYAKTVGKDLLDQKTLLTLATPTPDNPKHYVDVKWSAVESPSKIARNRDFCYIECHDEFIDSNTKRRGWVKSIHSIRLPFCPPLHQSHGLVRGSFYRSGYIFTESAEKGCVDAVHTLHVDIKGNAPNWLKILVMKRRIKNIAEVDRHFQLQRLTRGKLLGDLELPDKEKASRCQLCETRFGFFHRRRLCRKCGKVVCTPCGNEFLLDYPGLGPKKVQVCLKCSGSVVYGTSVPMMDDIIPDENSVNQPVYDESSSGPMSMLENQNQSVDEHEYYLNNEVADIEEAKRMNKKFEETLKKSSDEVAKSVAQQGTFQTSPKSLFSAISVSSETIKAEMSPNAKSKFPSSSEQWRERKVQNEDDDTEDEDKLFLAPSKREQVLQQMHYEEHMRSEQIQKLHQYATYTRSQSCTGNSLEPTEYGELQPLRPRAHGIVRNGSEESLRLSSELSQEYCGKYAIGHARPGASTSFPSNESVHSCSSGVTESELVRYRSRSQGGSENRYSHDASPRHHDKTAPLCRNESHEEGQDSVERQRYTQQYFDARKAQSTVSGDQKLPSGTKTSDNAEHLFDDEHPIAPQFLDLDPPARRRLSGSEQFECPHTSLSDPIVAGAFTTHHIHQRDDLENRDDEAFRLAMSAMRLYDEERGPNLQVTEKTRQAALTKMMEVYAREIEHSHSNNSVPYRGTISDTRQLHQAVGILPLLRRTFNDDLPPSFCGAPLPVFSHDDMVSVRQRHRRAPSSKRSQGVHRRTSQQDTYAPTSPATQKTSKEAHKYRDLSDLTSSAFQAFHINSLGPKDASELPCDAIERFEDSDSSRNGFQQDDPHFVQVQRNSTCTTDMQLKPDTSEDISSAAPVLHDSIERCKVSKVVWRPDSMYGAADFDTFSDMDLVDLPHLMRKDEVDNAARSTFADLQHWTEDDAHSTDNGGVEYIPEPRFSDLLSPLDLEGVQHVDDDDSESQSSDASSQIDWRSSMQKKYLGEQERHEASFIRAYSIAHKTQGEYLGEPESFSDLTSGLSESMVTQNDEQPQRRYGKPPSVLELLSEYCESERSSLPSYLELGGSQPELEPEYLEAIENANNLKYVLVGGGREQGDDQTSYRR